jgi:hypothetical protein
MSKSKKWRIFSAKIAVASALSALKPRFVR